MTLTLIGPTGPPWLFSATWFSDGELRIEVAEDRQGKREVLYGAVIDEDSPGLFAVPSVCRTLRRCGFRNAKNASGWQGLPSNLTLHDSLLEFEIYLSQNELGGKCTLVVYFPVGSEGHFARRTGRCLLSELHAIADAIESGIPPHWFE